MGVQQLASLIQEAIIAAKGKGQAKRAIYMGNNTVNVNGQVYQSVLAVPITLWQGKQVWVQITENGTAVIIGD